MHSVKNRISTALPCAANSHKAQSRQTAVSKSISSTSDRGGKGSLGGEGGGGDGVGGGGTGGCALGWRGGILSGGSKSETTLQFVTFLDYLNTYHTQTIIGTALFLYLNPFTKAMSPILYDYILNLLYHCMIQSLSDPLVWYNLLQVRLSLVDAYLPLHSLAYLVCWDDEYLNCNSRALGP